MAFGTSLALKALLANGEVAQCKLRFARATEPTFADLAALAEEVAVAEAATIAALYSSDIAAFSIGCQNFTHVTPGGPSAPYWGPSSSEAANVTPIGPGTHAGESSTPQCAVVASLHTALPGRSYRGRLFGFPPPEDEVDSAGMIAGTHRFDTLVLAIAADVESSSNIDTAEFSVFSAKHDSRQKIVTVTQGPRIDTQRRRLRRE